MFGPGPFRRRVHFPCLGNKGVGKVNKLDDGASQTDRGEGVHVRRKSICMQRANVVTELARESNLSESEESKMTGMYGEEPEGERLSPR